MITLGSELAVSSGKPKSARVVQIIVFGTLILIWLWAVITGALTKVAFVNKEGKRILTLGFDAGSSFSDGLAAVRRNGKWGYVDKRGITIIPPTFAEAGAFRDGIGLVVQNGKVGFVDHKGKYSIAPN
jgi:hypothetical protein